MPVVPASLSNFFSSLQKAEPLMMEQCRFGTMCWRPLCPYMQVGAERIVAVPVPQIHEELVDSAQIIPQERIVEQTVELAESSGEAGSSWFVTNDTTSTASTAVAKSAGETGPSGPGANGPTSAATAAVGKPVVKPGSLCPRSTVPRENPSSQVLLEKVKLFHLGPEQTTRPSPTKQQLESLMKFGLQGP